MRRSAVGVGRRVDGFFWGVRCKMLKNFFRRGDGWRTWLLLIATINFCVATVGAVSAQKRVALVIGNSTYQYTSQLANPANDARLIAGRLQANGFAVLAYTNIGQREMRRAFAEYTSVLAKHGRDAVGLIYYAGHGLQVNGQNYILPVDAKVGKEADVEIEAINASTLMRSISLIGNKLNIVILDACRNNPYRSAFRSASAGLARMDAPVGSMVAFSTAPGMVAADGDGANSPYTESLARAMTTPGLKIEDMFKRVRNDVYRRTNGAQVPWESSSIFGDFYFAGAPPVGANVAKGAATSNPAAAAWATIQTTNSTAVLETYISKFPKSVYAGFAKARLKELRGGGVSAQPQRIAAKSERTVRDNGFRAYFAAGQKAIDVPVRWDVFQAQVQANGRRKRVDYTSRAVGRFNLKEGQYYVTAKFGNAIVGRNVSVRYDRPWGQDFILNAGAVQFTGHMTPEAPALRKNVRWDVFEAEKNSNDERRRIDYSSSPAPRFVLPAGQYYVTLKHGDVRANTEITVGAGQTQRTPLVLNAGRLALTAFVVKGGKPLKRGVRWKVFEPESDLDGKRERITYSSKWRPVFSLAAGKYYVTAAHGRAVVGREVNVRAGKVEKQPFIMNSGRLILTAALGSSGKPLGRGVRWEIFPVKPDDLGERERIDYSSKAKAQFVLPAGQYAVEVKHGAASVIRKLKVEPGKATRSLVPLDAGRVKLSAIVRRTMAKGRAKWEIYSAKESFEERRDRIAYEFGERPIFTLPAGRYQVVMSRGRDQVSGQFEVKAGDQREIGIALK